MKNHCEYTDAIIARHLDGDVDAEFVLEGIGADVWRKFADPCGPGHTIGGAHSQTEIEFGIEIVSFRFHKQMFDPKL